MTVYKSLLTGIVTILCVTPFASENCEIVYTGIKIKVKNKIRNEEENGTLTEVLLFGFLPLGIYSADL